MIHCSQLLHFENSIFESSIFKYGSLLSKISALLKKVVKCAIKSGA